MDDKLSIIFAKEQLQSLRRLNIIPGDNKYDDTYYEDCDNIKNKDV